MFYENKKGFYANNEVDLMEIYKYLPKLDCKIVDIKVVYLLLQCYQKMKLI